MLHKNVQRTLNPLSCRKTSVKYATSHWLRYLTTLYVFHEPITELEWTHLERGVGEEVKKMTYYDTRPHYRGPQFKSFPGEDVLRPPLGRTAEGSPYLDPPSQKSLPDPSSQMLDGHSPKPDSESLSFEPLVVTGFFRLSAHQPIS